MLLLMGVGNILFASSKHEQYETLLAKAHKQSPLTVRANRIPMFDPLNVDEQAKYLNKIESRLEFYDLVSRGGKVLVVMAALLAFGTLATTRALLVR